MEYLPFMLKYYYVLHERKQADVIEKSRSLRWKGYG